MVERKIPGIVGASIFLMIISVPGLFPFSYAIGEPADTPIFGESGSLDEAVLLAENMDFIINLPVDTPQFLVLTDIRLQAESEVLLIFSYERILENMTLPELLDFGGIMVIEKKTDPRDIGIIDNLREAGGQLGALTLVEIDGLFGYYAGEDETLPWKTTLYWIDDETTLEMLGGPEHYNQNDLIQFAESFTDWSSIKTSTTTIRTISTVTTTHIVILTTYKDFTVTTTTVVPFWSLPEIISDEEHPLQSSEPITNLWAFETVIIAILLAVLIILRKKK